MNRREMLGALGLTFFGHEVRAVEERLSGAFKFTLVDERFVCPILQLKDSEGGFTYNHVAYDKDGIFYFSCAGSTVFSQPYSRRALIYRNKNNFYINISDDKLQETKDAQCTHPVPGWQLAFNDYYPLAEKEGDFYVIPTIKEERHKHPIIQHHLQKLKEHYAEVMKIQEKWGYILLPNQLEQVLKYD